MAGRKFGVVILAQTSSEYHAMSSADQDIPGKAFEEVAGKYAGKVDVLRRYWTSGFTTDCSDVFILECDDLMDAHKFQQDLTGALARSGDPERFGHDVMIVAGVNPDA